MISKNLKQHIYDYLFCCLIFSLPYSLKIPNLLLILLCVFTIFDFKEIKNLKFTSLKTKPIIVLAVLMVYFLMKGIITGTISDHKYGLLVPVLTVPFLFLKVKEVKKVELSIVFTGFLLAIRALFGLLQHYLAHKTLLPFEGESVNEILYMERPYLGFFILVSVIFAFKLLYSLPKYKYFFAVYIVLAIGTIFIISARISAITLASCIVLYLIFYLKTATKYKLIFCGGAVLLLSISLLFSKNLQERLFILDNFDDSYAKFKLYEPRVIIWPCVYEIATSPDFNSIVGISSEKKINTLLTECYGNTIENKHRANFFMASELNTHNQFLSIYLSFGIIGLVLLVLFLVLQLHNYRKDFIKTALTIAIIFFFLVENVLSRQLGVYLFILLIALINLYPIPSIDKKK